MRSLRLIAVLAALAAWVAILFAACSSDVLMSRRHPPRHSAPDLSTARDHAAAAATALPAAFAHRYEPVTGAMSRSLPRAAWLVVQAVPFAQVQTGDLVVLTPDTGYPIVRWVSARSLGALLTHSDARGAPDEFPSYGRRPPADPLRRTIDPRAAGRSYARNLVGVVRAIHAEE